MMTQPIPTGSNSIVAEEASSTIIRWNSLAADEAVAAILPCCGSVAWARALAARRPICDLGTLVTHSDAVWQALTHDDWQQAFESHPRLGETHALEATEVSLHWSAQEQSKAEPDDTLREANARYENKFGRIFLFCAAGRTAPEILGALERRMANDAEMEWREAGEQQRLITRLRLERWLRGA